jgi:hypothetical protein
MAPAPGSSPPVMVMEIGYQRKTHYLAAWMLALTQLTVLNGRRWFRFSVGERLAEAGDGAVQEKEEWHE